MHASHAILRIRSDLSPSLVNLRPRFLPPPSLSSNLSSPRRKHQPDQAIAKARVLLSRWRRWAPGCVPSANPPCGSASISPNRLRDNLPPMEVEVKLRLPHTAAHQRLSDALAPWHLRTHLQENLFFDGAGGELAARRAVLRLRFYDGDARCVLSLKAKAQLSGGVSRVEEEEEDVEPPALGRACAADPNRLLTDLPASRIMEKVRGFFVGGGGGGEKAEELVCLGGFRNVRAVHRWEEEGLTLELDETHYDFGTSYELECETAEPERAKGVLEAFLRARGVPYSYSEASKFATFRAGKLLP